MYFCVLQANELFISLKNTMENYVHNNTSRWLDDHSKNNIIQKIKNMTFEVPHKFSDLDSSMNNVR